MTSLLYKITFFLLFIFFLLGMGVVYFSSNPNSHSGAKLMLFLNLPFCFLCLYILFKMLVSTVLKLVLVIFFTILSNMGEDLGVLEHILGIVMEPHITLILHIFETAYIVFQEIFKLIENCNDD